MFNLKSYVIACLAVGLAVALLELPVLVGLVDYRLVFHTPIYDLRQQPYNVPDDELLFRHRPYLHKAGVGPGDLSSLWCLPAAQSYPYDLRADANGFRNDADLTRADVAFVGDSFLEEPLVSHDALLTSVFARRSGLTVANLGLSAYGPQQELVVVRRYALPLRPQLVVWLFYEGNDLSDIGHYELARATGPSAASFWRRSLVRNAASTAKRLLRPCRPDPAAEQYAIQFAGRRVYVFPPAGPLSDADLAALPKLAAILREAQALCRAQGSRLAVAFVPAKFRVYRDAAPNDLPDRLRALLPPEAEFVDLTPALIAGVQAGREVYLPDDTHWTATGHEIAARILCDALGACERQRAGSPPHHH